MKWTGIVLIIASLALFQTGCSMPPRQIGMYDTLKFYSGSDLPTNEIAVVFIPGPLKYIPSVDEPDLSFRVLCCWNYKIALRPGTYTRSFLFVLNKPWSMGNVLILPGPDTRSSLFVRKEHPYRPGCVVQMGPSSPVTFTLEKGRQYAVFYTLKSKPTNQSLGLYCSELMQIKQTKDTNDVECLTLNNEPLQFVPLIVDITDDKQLAQLIQTNSDWLLRFYALDFIQDFDCVDLVALSTNDPNVNVRNRAKRLLKYGIGCRSFRAQDTLPQFWLLEN